MYVVVGRENCTQERIPAKWTTIGTIRKSSFQEACVRKPLSGFVTWSWPRGLLSVASPHALLVVETNL